MSKKNIKPRKYSFYRKYGFDRNASNLWNDMQYDTWLIMDEGRPKPPPQRLTNFMFKYGMKHKKTGCSILSYIPEENRRLMFEWIEMTKAERKIVREIAKQNNHDCDPGKKITHWLHQAEIMYLNEIEKYD